MPIGKRLTAEQKAEIIRLRIDEGLPVWGIAERFNVTDKTIYAVVKKHKEEPDTAATVTDSEQEDLVDVPADIVPQEMENVKADEDLLPCAVVDAVANEIDRLYDKLTECDSKMQKIKDARENAAKSLLELKAFLKKNGYGDVVKTLDLNAKRRALQGESANSL